MAGEADLGGTMRLGSYPAKLIRGTVTAESYGTLDVTERHRHRYEVNNAYRDKIAESGLVFSGTARRPAGRVRGVPARPPSVPGGHRLIRSLQEPTDPTASAVPFTDRVVAEI